MPDGFFEASHDPRVRWLFASLLLLATFLIGMAGFGLAGMGPCGFSRPIALLFSSGLSIVAIFFCLDVLTGRQRRLRMRTLPFYFCFLLAAFFVGLQILLLFFYAKDSLH
jgi:hypothetical protein